MNEQTEEDIETQLRQWKFAKAEPDQLVSLLEIVRQASRDNVVTPMPKRRMVPLSYAVVTLCVACSVSAILASFVVSRQIGSPTQADDIKSLIADERASRNVLDPQSTFIAESDRDQAVEFDRSRVVLVRNVNFAKRHSLINDDVISRWLSRND